MKTFASSPKEIVYLRPNETPIFTELYRHYGLLNPPAVHVYDTAIYYGQEGENSLRTTSNQALANDAETTLKQYHLSIHNLDLFLDPEHPKSFFCPANGSIQIIFGLVFAIVNSDPSQHFLFVEKIPYYAGHENAVKGLYQYPNARFQKFNDPKEIILKPGETLVEFVTSPNNPDGKFRQPYTQANIIIADFVFSTSGFGNDGTGYVKKNLEWLLKARHSGKHVFVFNSASKTLGKAANRFGYMWYPMSDPYAQHIFKKFFAYLNESTVSSCNLGIANTLDLISALMSLSDGGESLRRDLFRTIVKRHEVVSQELLKRYPGSEVVSIPGSPTLFAKISSHELSTMSAKALILKDTQVSLDTGEIMGATKNFVRVNLCGYSNDLADFLNQLSGFKKYRGQDLLTVSKTICSKRLICNGKLNVIHPNDCNIEVDATRQDIQILLPPFINYQHSNLVTIKKSDDSKHTVMIKSGNFTIVLQKKGDILRAEWTQPHFFNGQWNIKQ